MIQKTAVAFQVPEKETDYHFSTTKYINKEAMCTSAQKYNIKDLI